MVRFTKQQRLAVNSKNILVASKSILVENGVVMSYQGNLCSFKQLAHEHIFNRREKWPACLFYGRVTHVSVVIWLNQVAPIVASDSSQNAESIVDLLIMIGWIILLLNKILAPPDLQLLTYTKEQIPIENVLSPARVA